jgi:hypothetical protein
MYVSMYREINDILQGGSNRLPTSIAPYLRAGDILMYDYRYMLFIYYLLLFIYYLYIIYVSFDLSLTIYLII